MAIDIHCATNMTNYKTAYLARIEFIQVTQKFSIIFRIGSLSSENYDDEMMMLIYKGVQENASVDLRATISDLGTPQRDL